MLLLISSVVDRTLAGDTAADWCCKLVFGSVADSVDDRGSLDVSCQNKMHIHWHYGSFSTQ